MEEKYLVAIDFETANSSPLSICQVGIIVFKDGELVFEYDNYIKPPLGYDEFNFYNVRVHGITESDVENALQWNQAYKHFSKYFDNAVFVAHNASFDMRVLKNINEHYGISLKPSEYYCTVELSRKVFPYLPNHKLNTVSKHLDIDLNHHDAKSDAHASAMIIFKSLQLVEGENVSDLFAKTNMVAKTLST